MENKKSQDNIRIYYSGDCENGISETQYPKKRDIKISLFLTISQEPAHAPYSGRVRI